MRRKKRAYRLFRKNDTQRTNKLLGSSHFKELILHNTRSVGKGSHMPMVVYAYAHAQPSKHVA